MRHTRHPLCDFCLTISIHAPLTGCDVNVSVTETVPFDISIHAPLTGCDGTKSYFAIVNEISIHAPLTGCDVM